MFILSLFWSRYDNFESDLKICKEHQNVNILMFPVSFLRTQAGLWILGPEVDTKMFS